MQHSLSPSVSVKKVVVLHRHSMPVTEQRPDNVVVFQTAPLAVAVVMPHDVLRRYGDPVFRQLG